MESSLETVNSNSGTHPQPKFSTVGPSSMGAGHDFKMVIECGHHMIWACELGFSQRARLKEVDETRC